MDIRSLNEILNTGRKFISIAYIMAIIALVLLGTYLLKEWKIIGIFKEFFIVISPIFIGLLIAWLCDPIVCWLEKRKVPRILGCISVYLVLLGILFLLLYLLLPTFLEQIKDFIATIPDILNDLKGFMNRIFNTFATHQDFNMKAIKEQIYNSLESFGSGITTNLPNMIISFGKS